MLRALYGHSQLRVLVDIGRLKLGHRGRLLSDDQPSCCGTREKRGNDCRRSGVWRSAYG